MEIPAHLKERAVRRLSQFVGITELSSGNSIVWSGLTGFVGIVPRHLAEKLNSGEFDSSDPELAALEDEGLFFSDNEDEALVDVLESLARAGSQPTHYRLVLTGSCDLTCSYCIQAKIRKTMDSGFSTKVVDDLVRYVEHHSPPGAVEILLMGGEPLVDVPVAVGAIKDIQRAFSRRERNDPHFKLLTNGLQLSEFIDGLGPDTSLVRNIQVSLDQDRETHDAVKKDRSGRPTFDRVVAGARHAVAGGVPVTLRLNIHNPDNTDQILATCNDLSDGIGPGNFLIYPAMVIQRPLAANRRNWSIEAVSSSFSRFLVQFFAWHHARTGSVHPYHVPTARWINCPPKLGPPSMLGPRGEVYACTYAMPVSPNIDAELGKTASFPLSREQCETLATEVWNETCRQCKFVAFCTGSCSVKTASGQKFTADCESWPERFRIYGEILDRS
jgi:radical SAM protein with 4Fe4S-binding SPASM domain